MGQGLQPQYRYKESMNDLKEGNNPVLRKAIELGEGKQIAVNHW